MKLYLLVDEPKSGKTTLLKELEYTFVPDDSSSWFSIFLKLIKEGKKKIAIDDFRNKGIIGTILKKMEQEEKIVYYEKYKDAIWILPKDYEDIDIVLSTCPAFLSEIDLGLRARCLQVSVEELKKIKGVVNKCELRGLHEWLG